MHATSHAATCARPAGAQRLDRRRQRAATSVCASASGGSLLTVTLTRPLGIVFEEVKKGEEAGVFVAELVAGGNAQRAGLAVGDALVRVSATILKAGKEGEFEAEGYGQRPYENWDRTMLDVRAASFDTVMGAISSNNPRWGILDVKLELERRSAAPAAAPAPPSLAASPPAPAAPAPPAATAVSLEVRVAGGASVAVPSLSEDDVLRTAMKAAGAPVYDAWGSVWNCNGGGQCGLCTVGVVGGGELLCERTDAEKKHLKGKPADWRLACQASLREGARGELVLQSLPQKS